MKKERRKLMVWITGLFAMFAFAALIGCADDESSGFDASAVEAEVAVIEEVAPVVEVKAAFAVGELLDAVAVGEDDLAFFNDMLVVDSVVYTVFAKGLIAYDLISETYKTVASEEPLMAIAMHEDQIYVGGKGLYRLVDSKLVRETLGDGAFRIINPALESLALHFEDGITRLESFGDKLIIGTTNGLYSSGYGAHELLKEDVHISALALDETGLWIGTNGQGLFRWDGNRFHKRFLTRDSAIFDEVNAVDYNRGYVYVGTDDALYIFDGGKWETITSEQGLPSDHVTALDADGWVVNVGTARGAVGYFNGDFYPAKDFGNTPIRALGRIDNKMVAATDNALMMKQNRREIATLIESDIEIVNVIEYVTEGSDSAFEKMAESEIVDEENIIEELVEQIEFEELINPIETEMIVEETAIEETTIADNENITPVITDYPSVDSGE